MLQAEDDGRAAGCPVRSKDRDQIQHDPGVCQLHIHRSEPTVGTEEYEGHL